MREDKIISRVASRFLEASRANRTSWLLTCEGYKIEARTFKSLHEQLIELIEEIHGTFDFEFRRERVHNDGEIVMEYDFVEQRYEVGMKLFAENKREGTIELAKPIDISAFIKYLESYSPLS